MNNYEYFWVVFHKAGERDVEMQNNDLFSLMGEISKKLYDGWTVTYFKLMNRGD